MKVVLGNHALSFFLHGMFFCEKYQSVFFLKNVRGTNFSKKGHLVVSTGSILRKNQLYDQLNFQMSDMQVVMTDVDRVRERVSFFVRLRIFFWRRGRREAGGGRRKARGRRQGAGKFFLMENEKEGGREEGKEDGGWRNRG
jgi:hypothetical protein